MVPIFVVNFLPFFFLYKYVLLLFLSSCLIPSDFLQSPHLILLFFYPVHSSFNNLEPGFLSKALLLNNPESGSLSSDPCLFYKAFLLNNLKPSFLSKVLLLGSDPSLFCKTFLLNNLIIIIFFTTILFFNCVKWRKTLSAPGLVSSS